MGRKKRITQKSGCFAALNQLDINTYWGTVQVVIDEVCNFSAPQGLTLHEALFARYGLLATSILGGFCWPGAYRVICGLRFHDVAHLYEDTENQARYLQTYRNGIQYRITPHSIVTLALNQLVMHLLNGYNVGKRGLPLRRGTALGPTAPKDTDSGVSQTDFDYRVGLLTAYLQSIVRRQGTSRLPTLDDFLAVTSQLAWFVYDMDVRAALLGEVKTGTVLINLATSDLLRRLRLPLEDR